MNKSIYFLVLLVIIISTACTPKEIAVKKEEDNSKSFNGTILEVRKSSFAIEPDENEDEYSSYIVSKKQGLCVTVPNSSFDYSKLKKGQEIAVVYDGIILESVPPQIIAREIKIK